MQLVVNGRSVAVTPDWEDAFLLHWLREAQGLVGTRFGCGAGACGACTVLLDGEPVRSCLLRVDAVGPRPVTTVEGLARDGRLHPVQQAWLDANVPQCGYCQSGQMLSTVALLRRLPQPGDTDIDAALAGHLCRCGTHQRVRAAVRLATGASS